MDWQNGRRSNNIEDIRCWDDPSRWLSLKEIAKLPDVSREFKERCFVTVDPDLARLFNKLVDRAGLVSPLDPATIGFDEGNIVFDTREKPAPPVIEDEYLYTPQNIMKPRF